MKNNKKMLFGILAFLLLLPDSHAFAQSTEEKSFLALFFKEEELVVQAPTRSPQPVSRTAENVTIVTAADIETMNAHTLADVLNTVTGFEVWMTGGPGQIAQGSILGSDNKHVTVIMDGVHMNYVNTGIADLGWMPVQEIEKIEIIKGPASSAWGSALGGVVNIITKTGRSLDQGAVLSGSYGNKQFADLRAEARGKQDRFGYYVNAGRLQSDGLTPDRDVSENSGYMKLTYDVTRDTSLLFAFNYMGTTRNNGLFTDFDFSDKDRSKHLHSTFGINSALAQDISLDISVHAVRQYMEMITTILSTGDVMEVKDNDTGYGGSAKITYRGTLQTIVVGLDSYNRTNKSPLIAGGEQTVRDNAIYANDTIALGDFAIIPGVRFDRTNSNGDITSPSLGLTYTLANNTVFRAFGAKGFSIPTPGETAGNGVTVIPNPDLTMETVWSYQAGVETAALKYVWLKLMIFRNDVRNGLVSVSVDPPSDTLWQAQNVARQRREGIEVELRTKPVFNTSLFAGAEFITAKDRDTGEHIKDVPVQVYDVGLRYDDQKTIKALLQGRHINWNAQDWELSQYDSMLVDLALTARIYQHRDSVLEAFANAHNLLNTQQYLMYFYPNPERWYEAGLRYMF